MCVYVNFGFIELRNLPHLLGTGCEAVEAVWSVYIHTHTHTHTHTYIYIYIYIAREMLWMGRRNADRCRMVIENELTACTQELAGLKARAVL